MKLLIEFQITCYWVSTKIIKKEKKTKQNKCIRNINKYKNYYYLKLGNKYLNIYNNY